MQNSLLAIFDEIPCTIVHGNGSGLGTCNLHYYYCMHCNYSVANGCHTLASSLLSLSHTLVQ